MQGRQGVFRSWWKNGNSRILLLLLSGIIPAILTLPGQASEAESLATASDISRDPSDLPGPLPRRAPTLVRIDLQAREVDGKLTDGAIFRYWTFDGKVPGPFLRVRIGDTVEVHLRNDPGSRMVHSVDLHAAWGYSGGATLTQAVPGAEKVFTFRALNPGLYLYHCGTPVISQHIANGMYGLILVEPPGGLPKVDREFYFMQGEIYTSGSSGSSGSLVSDLSKILQAQPDYFVFNGSVGSLLRHPLRARVDQKVRIYFGNAGPNFSSNLHALGAIFERIYEDGSVATPPMENSCSIFVPAGGAGFVEFTPKVPGKYPLVDHFFARQEKGLGGELLVTGPLDPSIIHEGKAR
ncbi:nitrite reductase (NO-forming) [Methylacidimicrobium tartarophylax]|uniref:Copper-containing nitrite reductase n=1 Tax=Methylacidimicrobium tartarophylax TaxID=1041768 RepID=A0A5E6MEH3_9BACT|nr:nitrite reductase (NO-forming) [Methylacidimicrobium tartarophylax]